jgi:Ice-binding-like/Bacterial Ig-like domain
MYKSHVRNLCIAAFLSAVVLVGCSDNDRTATSTNPGAPLTPPAVTSVTPPDASTLVCPNTAVITATFSKAMNPATITTSTFTVTNAGASIAGQVSYVSATNVATFTPAATLPVNTTLTVTITTGAKDTFGNPLTADKIWTFTTSPACPPPPPPSAGLGAACTYGILAATTSTNTGATTVRGDLGLSPGSSVTGFQDPPANTYVGGGTHTGGLGLVTGTIHLTDPPPPSPTSAAAAQAALTVAYLDLAGRTAPAPAVIAGDLGGLTLAPGLYKSTSTIGITGALTLDAGGNANAIWIFQIASSLTTLGNSSIVLAGGAQPHNIFWQVGSSATLGTNSTFSGSILALSDITLTTGATLNGRALARNGAVTLDTNMVNVPPCP